jgi:hypothetical protein
MSRIVIVILIYHRHKLKDLNKDSLNVRRRISCSKISHFFQYTEGDSNPLSQIECNFTLLALYSRF